MNGLCLTIEKTYMLRRSLQYKDIKSKDISKLEETLLDALCKLYADKRYTPPYWNEELDEIKQRSCQKEMLTLAYAVCIMAEEEQGELDSVWFDNIRHTIETQLVDADRECSYYVMLEAFLIMRLLVSPLKHSQQYWHVLELACKEKTRSTINDDTKTYECTDRKYILDKFTMLAIEISQHGKYAIDFSEMRPSREMVFAANVDWCFYTHGFVESYMKAWINEYALCEHDKSTLISNMEQCFEKMVEQHEKRRKEAANEEMDDF